MLTSWWNVSVCKYLWITINFVLLYQLTPYGSPHINVPLVFCFKFITKSYIPTALSEHIIGAHSWWSSLKWEGGTQNMFNYLKNRTCIAYSVCSVWLIHCFSSQSLLLLIMVSIDVCSIFPLHLLPHFWSLPSFADPCLHNTSFASQYFCFCHHSLPFHTFDFHHKYGTITLLHE